MRREGFTLVELIVVVFITGLLGAFCLVSIATYTHGKLEAEARKLAADISWARDLAMTRHEQFSVNFDLANDLYRVIDSGNVEWKRRKVSVDIFTVADFSGASLSPAWIVFFPPHGSCADTQVGFSWGGKSTRVIVYGSTGYAKTQ